MRGTDEGGGLRMMERVSFSLYGRPLLAALKSCNKVVISRPVIPDLALLRVQVDAEGLNFTASDTETTLQHSIRTLTVEGSALFLVDGGLMADALAGLENRKLEFSLRGADFIDVDWDEGGMTFPTYPADNWPEPVMDGSDVDIMTETSVLAAGMESSLYAAAKDGSGNNTLEGMLLAFTGNSLDMVATDTHILSLTQVQGVPSLKEASFVLPRRSISLLRPLLPSCDTVLIRCSGRFTQLRFPSTGVTMLCRNIEGRFPSYRSIMPANCPFSASLKRKPFLEALRRISCCSPSSGFVELSLENGMMTVSASDAGNGTSGEEHIPCGWNGGPFRIGFNSRHLIPVIEKNSEDKLLVELQDEHKAVLVKPDIQEKRMAVRTIVMPVCI